MAAAVIGAGCAGQAVDPAGYLSGAGGAQIYYEVAGSGSDTVVVVHGGPGAGLNDIRPDLEPLAERHTVIYYDQRGGGRSELPADTSLLSAPYFVGDLDSVRAFFGLRSLDVVAHSFGAIIVAAYVRDHPNRVGRIVLLAATGPSRQQAAEYYRTRPATSDTVSARSRSEILRHLMEGRAEDPEAACREYERLGKVIAAAGNLFTGWKSSTCEMPAEAIRYYYRYTARLVPESFGDWDFREAFADLSIPVLVIDGEQDTAGLPMEQAWSDAFPNGRLLVVPRAGRVAYAERPEVVLPAVSEFLAPGEPLQTRAEGVISARRVPLNGADHSRGDEKKKRSRHQQG